MTEAGGKSTVRRQGRSPSYPSVPLSEAIETAKAQYEAEGKYPAPLSSAFKAWGYSLKSSGGRELRASLRYFGLILVEGEGEFAKVRLTEDAINVLVDHREDQTERNAIIRRLALNPSAHKKLWTRFPEGIKSEASAAHFLIVEEGYNENAAQILIKQYKQTAEFASLYQATNSDRMPSFQTDKTGEAPVIEVGDSVQIELDGTLQPGPFRIRRLQEHDGNIWVFVHGSDSAVPISRVTLERKGPGRQANESSEPTISSTGSPPLPIALTVKPEEREWLRGELSKQVAYRLIVSGDVGPREISKLITLLRAQQAVLSDDYDAAK